MRDWAGGDAVVQGNEDDDGEDPIEEGAADEDGVVEVVVNNVKL